MPFWNRRQEPRLTLLPRDIARQLDAYGRCEFDVHNTGVALGLDSTAAHEILPALYPAAQRDPDLFLTELAGAALPAGGWTVYGAARLIWDLFSEGRFDDQRAESILSESLRFLQGLGVPRARIRPYEWDFWTARHPSPEPWIAPRPGYDPAAQVTELHAGELRRVAQLQPGDESNVIFVRRGDDGDYVAVVDAQHGVDSPLRGQRGQFTWHRAPDLQELYVRIGESLEILPHWCDAELEYFIPLPKPSIPLP